MTRPVLTVAGGRHPAEVAIFAQLLASGVWGLLIPGGQSRVLQDAFPWFVTAFYVQIAMWGAAGLIALALRDQDTRMRAERCACWGVGYCSVAYGICVFFVSGVSAGMAAFYAFSVSAFCTYRIVQISVERRRIRRATVDPHSPTPMPLAGPDDDAREAG